MGDLGGYGIAELPPAGPLFARGPYRALGQKGNPWEVVRNSISAHVTHAEITHCCNIFPLLEYYAVAATEFFEPMGREIPVKTSRSNSS